MRKTTTQMKKTSQINSGVLYRSFEIDRAAMKDGDDRTVELSFSSEAPVEQYNWDIGRYLEILDHGKDSVNLSRLAASAPLLLEHDRGDQIGVVEEASIGEDRKGRAKVRFGNSSRASEIYQDVKDGIRRLVSVGYRVHELVTEKVEENGLKTLRAIGWTPMEISIVSVPADVSVGVGRSEKSDGNKVNLHEETKEEMKIDPVILRDANSEGGGGSAANPPAPLDDPKVRSEHAKEMLAMARKHDALDLYSDALEKGHDINQFRASLLSKITSTAQPQTEFRSAPPERKNIGELLTSSEGYRSAIRSKNLRSISMEVPILGTRATLLTSTGVTSYERPPGVVLLDQQPLTVAALFSQGETTAATVRVLQEVSFTNAATAVEEEGQKPEASFDLVETDFGVKKIAVLGRVSDEMFSDFPVVRDYVNSRLVYMVGAKEDSELLNGTGLTGRLTGVLQTSGIQTVSSAASSTVIDAIHKGITKVRSTGFLEPDGIVLNPNDWQNIRLSKDSNGQYYAGGPFNGQYGSTQGYSVVGTLWGLPVAVTTSIAQGTALVGAFKIGAQIFRRMGVTVDTTNSDASDFAYNRICIRVETRLALAVYRPLAFCTVTSIPA